MLLCYNDGDILPDALEHLLNNHHDVVVWNHGSTDETADVLARFAGSLREVTDISRDVDFYDLYPLASKHLMATYVHEYDWISWPDQDELLEGPTRTRPYHAFLEEAVDSPHGWIEFNDYVFWFTERDRAEIASPCERVRHYSLARHGAIKVRSWRASETNIRWFNHNKTGGSRHPDTFNLRHYPMRSEAQMRRRLAVDRANLQRGPVNYHYENMKATLATVRITADGLHYDDGVSNLDPTTKFDWSSVYGVRPELPREVFDAFVMSTKRWEIARVLDTALGALPAELRARHGADRIDRWRAALRDRIACPVLIALKRDAVTIVTEQLAQAWTGGASEGDGIDARETLKMTEVSLEGLPFAVEADSATRRVSVQAVDSAVPSAAGHAPLVTLVPCFGSSEPARLTALEGGRTEFRHLRGQYYYLACEPSSDPGRNGERLSQ